MFTVEIRPFLLYNLQKGNAWDLILEALHMVKQTWNSCGMMDKSFSF